MYRVTLQQDVTSLSLSLWYVAKNIDLEIEDVDYLRILEGGNFIHFVAIVYDTAEKLSVVKTANYRLRVSSSQGPPKYCMIRDVDHCQFRTHSHNLVNKIKVADIVF